MLGIFVSLVNFLSFLSGIVFGIFLATATVLYFVSNKNNVKEEGTTPTAVIEPPPQEESKTNLLKNKPPVPLAKEDADRINSIIVILEELNSPLKNISPIVQKIHQNTVHSDINTLETKMKNIIDFASISRLEKEFQDSLGELKDQSKQVKLLSSFLNDISKYFLSFSKDLTKLSNVAKNNLHKASASIEFKQDLVVNNWWQLLMTAFDHMSTDYQEFAGLIGDELLNYSNQIQDEIILIDKRLTVEGNKQFNLLRDNLNLFDNKLKERDKALEKLRNTPVPQGMTNRLDPNSHHPAHPNNTPNSNPNNATNNPTNLDNSAHTTLDRTYSSSSFTTSTPLSTPTTLSTTPLTTTTTTVSSNSAVETYQRRYIKYKSCDEALKLQTRRLYEVQKEFYLLYPRYGSDIQITVIKSIVETQSQLLKLHDGMKQLQSYASCITTKLQLALTNTAASFIQMLTQENKLLFDTTTVITPHNPTNTPANTLPTPPNPPTDTPTTTNTINMSNGKCYPSIALDIMKSMMIASGIKGYELTLYKVLEGLMLQSQLRDVTTPLPTSSSTSSTPITISTSIDMESTGKLNMYTETTACLAAHNPQILPQLPKYFHQAIGIETCIWFNAFSGRVYRDIANSDYFYHWFCSKVSIMLNKQENKEKLPDYIDKFEVCDVVFGELPPLLCNMKWSPYHNRKKTRMEGAMASDKVNTSGANGTNGVNSGTSEVQQEEEEDEEDKVDLLDASDEEEEEGEIEGGGNEGEHVSNEGTTTTDAQGNTIYTTSYTGKLSAGLQFKKSTTTSSSTSTKSMKTANQSKKETRKPSKKPANSNTNTGPTTAAGAAAAGPSLGEEEDESYYYAACTADLAFRSGIKFTVKTK